MIRKNLNRSRLAVVLSLFILVTTTVHAQTPSSGISLTPFETELSVSPTDGVKSFALVLVNHSSTLQELDLSTKDFGSLNDTGGILLEGNNAYSQKYGLISWLSLEADTVVLKPGESRSVLVSINNQTSLIPGGHYGAIVASVNSLNDQSGNKVVINQQLISLILVDKSGGEKFDLKLAGETANGNWLHLPNVIKLRFQNPGNVHVIPRGLVKLLSPSGHVVATGIINDDSAFVLPETFRDIYVSMSPKSGGLSLPGIYHVEVDYRYDGFNKYAVQDFAVHYIDLKLYLILGLIVLAGLWMIRRYAKRTKNQ